MPRDTVGRRHPEHVDDISAAMWNIEKDPQLRNTLTALFVLDGPPERAVLRERLEHVSRAVPGFRHRLVTPPLRLATPRWVLDRDYDPSYHLRWIGAPEPRTLETVLEYARQSAMSGLDRDRPLWMFTVVEGLRGDRAAVVVKLHHVLTDGVGGMDMLPLIVDLGREPTDHGPMPPVPEERAMTRRALVRDALETNRDRLVDFVRSTAGATRRGVPDAIRHPADAARTVTRNLRAVGRTLRPQTETLSPIMVERHGWSRFATHDVDLDDLRRAARSRAATINDAFVTAVANGFARYHDEHHAPVERLRASVAVSTRRPDDPLGGNRIAGGQFLMPVGTDDPGGSMVRYHDLVRVVREDARQPLTNAIGVVTGGVGPLVSGVVASFMKHCDFSASNVPGIGAPIFVAGAEVTDMYGFGPTMGAAANVTLLSYRGTAHIGLNVDAGAVPDVGLLTDCIRRGFDAVLALAD